MSFTGSTELNQMGGLGTGFGGFGGGGFGAFGLIGLLGLDSLGRRRGGDDGDCCEDIKNNARNLAVLEGLSNNKDATVAEGRNLANAICESEKTNLQQFYAAAIQAANNTQSIKDQAQAFAVVADARFDALTLAGVNQTAAILARINDVETQGLRDQLFLERRRGDNKDIEISIQNSNAQAQAQFQAQNNSLDRKFDALFNQVAKSNQDIINVGGLMAGVAQSANPVNVKS